MVQLFRSISLALLLSMSVLRISPLFAANCEQEIEERVEELRSKDEFDRHFSIDLYDLNRDGRNEILYSESCNGNGCMPEIDIDWFSSTCKRTGKFLDKWIYVHGGWKDIKFSSSFGDTVYMTASNERWDSTELFKSIWFAIRDTLFDASATYAFDGKQVFYVSKETAEVP